jgi:hypothetical protein
MPLPDELVAKFKARKNAPATPPPQVEGEGGSVPDIVKNLLLGGSFVGAIPHPVTRGIGMLSSLGLAGIEGTEAVKAAAEGDMAEAGSSAFWAALGGSGAIGFLRNIRKAQPTLASMIKPLEERAERVAKLEETIRKVKNPTKQMQTSLVSEQRKLAAEARRVFREQRLTARELRLEGKAVPKELRAAISKAAKASEALGESLQPVVKQPMKEAIKRTAAKQKAAVKKGSKATAEAQRAEAALTGLMQKLGAPEEVIKKTRESLKKQTNVSKVSKKAFEEIGASASEILLRVSGALAGGLAGGAAGANARPEDAEKSQMAYALAGAGMGALAGGGLAALAMSGSKKKVIENLTDFNFFSLLSAPGAVGKAALGSVMSVVTGAAIRVGEGRFNEAGRILTRALDDTARGVFFKAMTNPQRYIPAQIRQQARVPIRPGMLGYPTRVIAAADAVSSRALQSGGFSRAEALRFNLSGDPQTAPGIWFATAMGLPVTRMMPRRTS